MKDKTVREKLLAKNLRCDVICRVCLHHTYMKVTKHGLVCVECGTVNKEGQVNK